MNKRLHRAVFNAARGMRVAVQETARVAGKASGATPVVMAAVLMSAWPVSAQIAGAPGAPPNLQPTVLLAPNGIPLVSIQTPSAAGVSRNLYNQFDVQPRGVILNNSRTNVQTQLGGWVQGNPYLATGSARVILNEITSGNPTQLRGAIEVGGQRAEVIVANSAGIAVDGATFINASRATLTTGTPQLNAFGGLDGYVVRGGTINFDGAGLDARGTDYAAILARAVQVNAGIWANELKVVAGANQVSADHAQATPTPGTATPPAFALDVSHLGGMYAGKITLIGTEAGLGVRNAGAIGAAAGELVVTAAGRLENRGTLEARSLQIAAAGDIDNRGGTMRQASGVGLTLSAVALSNTAGGVIGAEPVPSPLTEATAQPSTGSGGASPPATQPNTAPGADTRTGIGGTGTASPPRYVPAPGHITATGNILNDGGHLYASGPIQLQTPRVNNSGGAITTTSLAASGPSFSNAGGTLNITGSFSAHVDHFDNTGGTLRANTLQVASSGDLLNTDGQLASDGPATLSAGGLLDNTRGSIRSATDLSIQAGELSNSGALRAGNDARIEVAGDLANNGSITSARHTTITAASVQGSATGVLAAGLQDDGTLGITGDLQLTSTGALQARGTNLAAGNATLQAAGIDLSSSITRAASIALGATQGDITTRGATITTPGTLSATANGQAGQTLVNQGGQLSAGQLKLRISNLANTAGGEIVQTAATDTRIDVVGTIDNNAGTLASNGHVTLTAATLNNDAGRISALGELGIATTGPATNIGGSVQAGGALVVNSTGLDNTQGSIFGDSLHLDTHGGGFDNRGGQTQALGELRIDAGAIDNTAGLIRSGATTTLNATRLTNAATRAPDQGIEGRDVLLSAGHLDNRTGAIRADADATLASSGVIDNRAGLVSAGHTLRILDPAAGTPTPTPKTLALLNTNGKLVAAGSLSIDAATFGADGHLSSGRDLSIALTQDIVHTGELAANGSLSYTTTGDFTNRGRLLAGQALTVTGRDIHNAADAEMSADTTVASATGTLTNRGLIDGQDTRIDAASVHNLGSGRLYGDALSIGAGALVNDAETVEGVTRAATIAARNTLDIGASTLTNRDRSLIFSAGDLYIGGALDANRYATGQGRVLDNLSADIESLGHMSIRMAEVRNRDLHIRLGTPTVTQSSAAAVAPVIYLHGASGLYPLEQVRLDPVNGAVFLRQPDGSEQLIGLGGYGVWTHQLTTTTDTATDLAPARLAAGGNLTIDGRLVNQDSQVLAGGTLRANDYQSGQLTGSRTTTGFGFGINDKGEVFPPVPLSIPPETLQLGAYRYASNLDATTGSAPGPIGNDVKVEANAGRPGGVQPATLIEVPASNGGGLPAVVRTSAPNGSVPTASLFSTRPEPGSRYLVETDPRFANYRQWMSSDYLLRQLGLDPDVIQKRLGDGFYEQRLVREQLAQLTGHRYLEGFQSDEEQYAALMSAGATFAREYGLTPGIALTAAQMAQLTSDIVWLVEQAVTLPDGSTQRVLVPQVYVRVRPGDVDGSGALLSADAVRIQGGGDITNTGTIAGRTLVSLNAANVNNLGGRISGGHVALTAKNDIHNLGGTLDARAALTLAAGRDIHVQTTTRTASGPSGSATGVDRVAGLYVSNPGGTLLASAGHDVHLIGAIVSNQGAGGLTAITAGNDIRLGTVRESSTLTAVGRNMVNAMSLSSERGSTIATQGTTVLNAGRDVLARQADVDAGDGLLSVQAGRDIRIESGETRSSGAYAASRSRGGFLRRTTNQVSRQHDHRTSVGSSFSGGLVSLDAGNDIGIEGSHISGTQGVMIDAGRHLSIVEGRNTRSASIDVDKKRSSAIVDPVFMQNRASGTGIDVRTDTAAASTITSGQGGVLLQGGGVVHLQGVQVAAAKDIRIEGGEVHITAAAHRSEVGGQQRQRGGDFGPLGLHDLGHGLGARASDTLNSETTSLARTTLSGANVRIAATGPDATGGELHIAGTTVHTPGTLSLEARTLYLETQGTVATLETGSQRRDFAWQQQRSRGISDETTNYNQFNAATLAVHANRVQAGLGARDSIEQLANQPGMGWVGQLDSDPNLGGKVDWVQVEEAHRHWDYRQQGLTPEGAAIVTLVVAYFTAGAASGAGAAAGNAAAVGMGEGLALSGNITFLTATGATISTVVGGAVTAGVTALASQASVALINNRGDIAGALDDLGSSASVKHLLTAIVTGGVLAGLNMNPTGLPTVGGGAQPFMTQLGQNLTAGVARALIGTAINGGSFEDNLKEGLKNALLDTVAAQGANAIGDLTANGALDDFTNKVAHAIAGCAVGAARAGSDGCTAGALGAAIGELAAEAYGRRADTVQFAALMSGIAVALAGGDAGQINIGSQAGSNAAANNYLAHPAQIRDPRMQDRILAAGQGCKGPASCEGVAAQAQAQIDLLSDDKIAVMCGGDIACVSDRQLERSIYARTRDEATSKLDPNTAASKFLSDQAGKSPYRLDELSAAVTRMQSNRSDPSNPADLYVRDTLATNPPLFAAILGVSVIDGDGGRSASKRSGVKFADDAKLQDHFERHGGDFGARSAAEYEARARRFLTGTKSSDVLQKSRSNGDLVRFNPATDEFGVISSDGKIRTYYKPDPAVHGKGSNLDYFYAQ